MTQKLDVPSGTPPGVAPDPATVADGLREVADWLDAHPELAAPYDGSIGVMSKDRADLERFAAALGDGATESLTGTHVHIVGHFGRVRVYSRLPIEELTGTQYEPILKREGDDA